MKKSTKVALLVAVILIAVGATLCNIARGRGEDLAALVNSGGLTISPEKVDFRFDQTGYTVCAAGEESFLAADVTSLDLSWLSGEVTVEPHDGTELLIREESRQTLSDSQRMRWRLSGGRLSVLCCANGVTHVPEKTLTVLVPRDWIAEQITADAAGASVSLKSLDVRGEINADTVSGRILVQSCTAESLELNSASGEIRAEQAAVRDEIEADTISGAVSFSRCACAKLETDTTSGGVTLQDMTVSGETEIDTVSGDVTLSFEGRPGRIEVDTTSGAVMLTVPKGTELDLDFESVSGKLSGSMTTAKGGLPVQVDTVSGNLTIREG